MTTDAKQDASAAEFWDCSDECERLIHTEISEAVEDWADGVHPDPLPETVEVYGFAALLLPPVERMASELLANLLERLDEDYGDPEDTTAPTQAMQDAALAFATVVRAEYDVWRCDIVTREVVRVADHVPAEWMQPAPETPR